ncbi:MAG: hypothetical protein HGB37_01375 [Candidatus Moranbacteria bacterium]|nr:hypothetical protein [Candidatus Moranbacteria bacterium]
MIVSKVNFYLYINQKTEPAMKNPQLPLPLQHARHITNGHYDLTKLVAHFYLFGGKQYSEMESKEMTVRFLEMAPCTGDTLFRLFQESGKSFEEFVAEVIAGKYFLHAVGQSIGSFVGIQMQLARIALRHSAQMVGTIFSILDRKRLSPPIHSE